MRHGDDLPVARRPEQHVASDEPGRAGDNQAAHALSKPAMCSAYHGIVREMPDSSETVGLKPSSVCAFSIDGTRRSTSGPGCGLNTIVDLELVRRMIMFASSKLVIIPWGLPRLKAWPIASGRSAQRSTPSTKSSTKHQARICVPSL